MEVEEEEYFSRVSHITTLISTIYFNCILFVLFNFIVFFINHFIVKHLVLQFCMKGAIYKHNKVIVERCFCYLASLY